LKESLNINEKNTESEMETDRNEDHSTIRMKSLRNSKSDKVIGSKKQKKTYHD